MPEHNESDPPVAHTRYGDVTLDEIAEIQPGMARLMLEYSQRMWIAWYAAKAGNWELARHEVSEARKLHRAAEVTRPKYTERLRQFEREHVEPLLQAIAAKEWTAFEAAFAAAVEAANRNHDELGYAYIQWQVPKEPPGFLRLEP